jgi:hypothetical protein
LIRTTIAILLLGATVASAQTPTKPAFSFKNGTNSSGWIDCKIFEGTGIFFPVKINGHAAIAYLYGGPSGVDEAIAAPLGLFSGEAKDKARHMNIELGDLTVQGFGAADSEFARPSQIVGQPVPLLLGEEIFKQFAVEIDFSHKRIAFRDPVAVTRPKGAMELPIAEVDGERVVPVSVNGAPLALFEFELGNTSGPMLVTPLYAKEHKLLEGAKTSQRLSGKFTETVVSVPHLTFAGVETPAAPIALIPDSEVPPPTIAGGMGLPLIERFDVVIDYPHNRIYATPHKDAGSAAYPKDRLGLVVMVQKEGAGFTVAFVSPDSPAANAGFKVGDKIASINGLTAERMPFLEMVMLHFADAGKPSRLRWGRAANARSLLRTSSDDVVCQSLRMGYRPKSILGAGSRRGFGKGPDG